MAKREKEQMDKQRSTKHTHKTNDRVSSSCSTNGTSCVNLVTYPVNELKANTSILVECILTFFQFTRLGLTSVELKTTIVI
jgi:hypothetical protein